MGQFWIGDTHFGHQKVSDIRGFANTDAHDEHIINQIQELSPGDRLWVLGDISGGRRGTNDPEQRAIDIFRQLKEELAIEIHLKAGNHDSVSSIHRNGFKHQDQFRQGFDSIEVQGRFRMMGQDVLMSHYPYAAAGDGDDRSGARYIEWRLQDVGYPLVHAHTHHHAPHSRAKEDNITRIERDGLDYNSLCVSWDARRGLTNEKHMLDWLNTRNEIIEEAKVAKVRNFFDVIHAASVTKGE